MDIWSVTLWNYCTTENTQTLSPGVNHWQRNVFIENLVSKIVKGPAKVTRGSCKIRVYTSTIHFLQAISTETCVQA